MGFSQGPAGAAQLRSVSGSGSFCDETASPSPSARNQGAQAGALRDGNPAPSRWFSPISYIPVGQRSGSVEVDGPGNTGPSASALGYPESPSFRPVFVRLEP